MRLPHVWARAAIAFDDENLISCAGLAPVMGLAEKARLSDLLDDRLHVDAAKVASAGVNPAGKITSIVAGMAAGADYIDDLNVIRVGGMAKMFDEVYAPATLGQFLREFTLGYNRQLASVARAHLVGLAQVTNLLPGIEQRALVDIDSLLRPVYGHGKEGASFGHAKIAGKQILRRGLSPLVTTISTSQAAPVVAGIRLRAGRAGSGRGAASMVVEAINTAREAGATDQVLVRGDSAYGNHLVAGVCLDHDARFSLVVAKNAAIHAAISTIDDAAWTPVHYPGSVVDPDTGDWISDAEVAEVPAFMAFATTSRPITARLVVRRVRDVAKMDELFPVWRYHPFITNNTEPAPQADITHRQHAIIETVHSDLIDGPLAHLPSGSFAANSAWAICAGICHNLLRAAGTLIGGDHAVARGKTLRRDLVTVPARIAAPQRRKFIHLPAHWPWSDHWNSLWHRTFNNDVGPPIAA